MASNITDSILSIQRWKEHARIANVSIGQGWGVTTEDRAQFERPMTFYVCEPLQSGFAAYAVFDRAGLEMLVETAIEKYGTQEEIFAAVTSVTMELLANPADASTELLDAVLTGALILSASAEAASQIVADQSCTQFGMIVYANTSINDVSFRPMDLRNQVQVSEEIRAGNPNANFEKDRLVLTLKDYVLHDEQLLPRFFEGVVVWDALFEFADKVRVDLPVHLDF